MSSIFFDGLVKSRESPGFVIPVKPGPDPDPGTGIQLFQDVPDSGFRRGDGNSAFYESVFFLTV
jgi:hypothetical protein